MTCATTLVTVSELTPPVSTPVETPRKRRQLSGLARVGIIAFVVGLVAVAVIMVLFATGSTELPLWLNLVAMLAPVGFGLGLLGVFIEARDSRRASALRNSGQPGSPRKASLT
jgi:ABC-type multidrug transport system permease subunit